jgi:hypothetical protein
VVRVHPQQQRVVVQHLLEMRYVPTRIDTVPGESATELIIDSAPGHPFEGQAHRVERGPEAGALEVPEPEQRASEYLAKFLDSEIKKWAAPIKASGVSVE